MNTWTSWARVIDFGTTSTGSQNFHFSFNGNYPPTYSNYFCTNGVVNYLFGSSTQTENTWMHLASTLTGSTLAMYVNAQLVGTGSGFVTPVNVVRTSNYIGRSNWGDPLEDITVDDIMIFNTAFLAADIETLMNVYVPNDFATLASSTLTYLWNFNQNLVDQVTGSELVPVSSSFITDRLNSANSAIYCASGYLQIPAAYFWVSGDFSMSMWVNMQAVTVWAR